jgi:ABC-type Zn uptake system ZnuABC Zn-binding protein ZnuA
MRRLDVLTAILTATLVVLVSALLLAGCVTVAPPPPTLPPAPCNVDSILVTTTVDVYAKLVDGRLLVGIDITHPEAHDPHRAIIPFDLHELLEAAE